jgi:3'(2'), 5'-bisphosphate nucleotidase
MEVYGAGEVSIQKKHDLSPVTEADLAAHRILVEHLASLLPNCPVVSEENEGVQNYHHGSDRFWLIDPLDGTKEFIARNGEFTVNVALVEGGRSVLGIVYAPAIDTLYLGSLGQGAFRLSKGEMEPIQVGAAADGGCRVLVSKSHLNEETQLFIDRLGSVSLIQTGSSLKFCRVAEGSADIYPRLAPTCAWDTAAAQAVLEAAGGAVVDLQGQPLRYDNTDLLNPSFVATRNVTLLPA